MYVCLYKKLCVFFNGPFFYKGEKIQNTLVSGELRIVLLSQFFLVRATFFFSL